MGTARGVRPVWKARYVWRPILMALVTACQSAEVPPPAPSPTPTLAPVAATAQAEWDMLQQRPLNPPTLAAGAPCPRAQGHNVHPAYAKLVGEGPVYAGFLGVSDGILLYASPQAFHDASWGGQRVLWVIAPSYIGPVLIRGRQLDGPHELLFDGGVDGVTLGSNLQLMAGPGYGTPWPNWPTYTRIEAPGCYAYQVDGLTFSYAIVSWRRLSQPMSSGRYLHRSSSRDFITSRHASGTVLRSGPFPPLFDSIPARLVENSQVMSCIFSCVSHGAGVLYREHTPPRPRHDS